MQFQGLIAIYQHMSVIFFFKLSDGTTERSSLIGSSHQIIEVITTVQVVTVWQSSKAVDLFQRGSDGKSTISRRACLTSIRSMAHARQMSQMSPR